MSAVDTSCYALHSETESGAGEMKRIKPLPCCSNTSQIVASGIMNDILDNVFEIIMAKNLLAAPKTDKITPNVVGDILENILSPESDTGVSNVNFTHDETALLDDEIKRIIKEMKYPPEQKDIVCTQGVGDQLSNKLEVKADKILSEPVKRNTLERKNRLTNLVRNSKHMLAKLVNNNNECENELRMSKSEEVHEKLLKVIDLEGNDNAMEAGSSSATGILRFPPDSSMDMVDLGTENENNSEIEKEPGEQQINESAINKVQTTKSACSSKKKWNFGAKIMKLIKRNKENRKE